jgi:D-sedoheptulose 7-phosphate isomerase
MSALALSSGAPPVRRARRAMLAEQLDAARKGLISLGGALPQLERWGAELRCRLERGARLLVAGNGGSAALAQHLTAELVGRYDHDRRAFSALALAAETSSLTAIANDYSYEQAFARQVEAHGRPGDVFMGLTTSGRSPNLLAAVDSAHAAGVTCWAMTGPAPNPLASAADDTMVVPCASAATIQDVQQVAIHLLCRAFELADPEAMPTDQANGAHVRDGEG